MILQFLALPFHVLMMKILLKDVNLALPRHKIMLSLCISDGLQVLLIFLSVCTGYRLTTGDKACIVLRQISLFAASLTLPVSSLAILALSFERYVACIHSFHLYQILTDMRVKLGTISVWIIGFIATTITVAIHPKNTREIVLDDLDAFRIIAVIFVIPVSIAVIIIQARLFFFSRKKLRTIFPARPFGVQAELADLCKKQLKVAIVASVVVISFVVCMIPLAVVYLYELLNSVTVSLSLKKNCIALVMVNAFIDPYIYGFGVADTRKLIIKNVRKIKQFIFEQILRRV